MVFELIYNSEVRPIVINFYKRGQYGADYEIDFRTCCANDHATDVKHATLADHNWQFNAESSSPAGNFRWIQMMPDSFGARPYDWIGGAGGAKDIVMDIHIPETGTYKMDIISATSIDGANTEVYLDDHKIGQYNSRDPNYPDSQNCGISDPFSMDLITVMKGTHKLKFKAIYNYEIRPSVLQFYKQDVVGGKVALQVGALESTAVGETHNVSLDATYDERPLMGATLENLIIESANSSIATAKIVTVDEKPQIAVTGVNPGTTTVKINTTVSGTNLQAELPVTIEKKRREDGHIIDFTKCQASGHSIDPSHATMEDHGWQLRSDLSSDKSMYRYINMTEFGLRARASKWLGGNDPVRKLVVDVEIPEDGFYCFDMVTAMNQDVGKSRVYVDGALQKEINGYVAGADYSFSKPIEIGYYYLAKGVHQIGFELWYNTEIYPAKFSFYPLKNEELGMTIDTVQPMNIDVIEEIPIHVQVVEEKVNLNTKDMHFEVVSENANIATAEVRINQEKTEKVLAVSAHSAGTTNLKVNLMRGRDVIATQAVPITVKEMTFDHISLEVATKVLGIDQEAVPIDVICWDHEGRKLNNSHATITLKSMNENVATVMWDQKIYPVAVGEATIQATATIAGVSRSAEVVIRVRNRKTEPTIYTPEKTAAARENIQKYAWARAESDKVVKAAEKYLGQEEYLWNSVTTQELPRSITVGWRLDPDAYTCRYCGADLRAKFGLYPWIFDALTMAWKIQCPDCRRKFPSNDFENYYKLGLDEHGVWSYEKAKEENAELVANGEDGYLKNVLYPEKDEELGVINWGVDDGWGYNTGKTIDVGSGRVVEEAHSYIAYYNHWALWNYQMLTQKGMIQDALYNLSMAYLYTGEERYGKVGAILVDRVADIYPSLNTEPFYPAFFPNYRRGKAADMTWETGNARNLVRAYDILFPLMENEQVIDFLSSKAEKYQLENTKETAVQIRDNCEDGILREVFKAAKEGNISGNFGMHQSTVVDAAVALDCMPDTKNMIDWAFQTGIEINDGPAAGGNVIKRLIDDVSRDGLGNEAAPGYNNSWIGNLRNMADTLAAYPGFEEANLYRYPKYIKMFSGAFPMILCRRYTPSIGDSGLTAGLGIEVYKINLIRAFQETGDIRFAQFLYALNGNSVAGIQGDIFTKNPEGIQQDILNIIDQYGEYAGFDKSSQMAGYGFTALRSGSYYSTGISSKELDTQRDFWMYYGIGVGQGSKHGHGDGLNLGIHAYGLDLAPDFGYPEACDGSDKYNNWAMSTISHNTVQVNGQRQTGIVKNGKPMHFDDSGRVKVMDVDAEDVYSAADIYRRTVVMVDVSDEISYGIDFFHVRGGNDHIYSFHALSQEITETEGLTLKDQVDENGEFVGSYAGPDVPYATTGKPSGYTYLTNVRKDTDPKSGEFAVDFKIMKNFRNVKKDPIDLNLRMTMLGDFKLDEVSLVHAIPPQRDGNPTYVEKVLARRTGEKLDTLFTTVFEPYQKARYIASLEQVQVTREDGSAPAAGEVVKAVRVTLTDGRTDYIVYAQNHKLAYRVDDRFTFQGFIGVLTIKDDIPVYSYLNDGTKIGDMTGVDAYTGTVVDFTRELTQKNTMTVSFHDEIDIDRLADHFIYIENDGKENAAYPIYGAIKNEDGTVTLDLGDMTMIRSSQTVVGLNATYHYNIAEGQIFRIPLETISESTPRFIPILDKSVEAGSELKFQVTAQSPENRELQYCAKELPRGAQFDSETQTFSWIPDSSQLGSHHVSFEVTDGVATATVHAKIMVYNGTSAPSGGGGTEKPGEDDKPPVVTEEDEIKFAASTDETTADTKLGSVTFPNGTFAEDGQGTLKIQKENEKFSVSVSATVDMNENPAKVSLNYTPADNMTDKNCIVVKDANGNIIPNGKYADGKIIFYTDTFGDFTIVYNPKSFTDLGNHTWAVDAVTRLAARGIINGITATTYGPARNITRADFTTLIVRAFGLEGEAASFADVPANAYYAEPVGIAKTLGIVGGVNESDFAPTAEITRQDMMVIVARALDKAGYVLDASDSPEFTDIDEVSDYVKDAVQMLTASGIIAGAGGKINPKGKTTRAEVAVILDRILFMAR